MESKKVMWLQNPGTADVSLSDLGVKVPAGQTIDIYKANPYLTEDRVMQSKKGGSLAKRLDSGIIRIVRLPPQARPPALDQLKASKKVVTAKKTKTSVVVDPNVVDEESGKGFEFADYGVNDIEDAAVKPARDKDSVVVNPRQDPVEDLLPISSKSKDIVENLQKKVSDPIGPLAPMESPPGSPMVVARTPKLDTPKEKVEAPIVVAKPTPPPEVIKPTEVAQKTTNGAVTVGEMKDPVRSLRAIAKGNSKDGMLDDTPESADEAIKLEETPEEGMRVATKSKDGVIIMQIKQETEKATKPVKKPRPSK